MDKNNEAKLKKFLATGEVPVEDAAVVMAVTKVEENPFDGILANLCAIEMLAKDFHYRAKGKSFYGNHIFADLLFKIGELSDKLNEIYYMGELGVNPPFRADVARKAVAVIDAIPAYVDEDGYIEALYEANNNVIGLVEKAKEGKSLSGTTAVLDEISQNALQNIALIKRVMSGENVTEFDADDVA